MTTGNNKPLIVIVGPTASGKTDLSIELALRINGEIVSADSMQVYKHMDIGTAKPSVEERKKINHYLIDEVEPDENFSVAKYKELADQYIDKIISENKTPIMVGGTGLYINTVIDNIQFSETVCDWNYRNELKEIANSKGNEYLHKILEEIDPKTAQNLHINDQRRIIRALEVYKYTKIPMSEHKIMSRMKPSPYKISFIGLAMDRELLYDRINQRVDIMIEQGLIDEVKGLMDMGYNENLTSMKGLGYKEIIKYLNGEYSFNDAVEILKRDTRRYAKRQLTWFRRDDRINWIYKGNNTPIKEIIEKSINYIEKKHIV